MKLIGIASLLVPEVFCPLGLLMPRFRALGRKMPRFRALGRKKERLGLGPRSKFKFTEHPRSSGGRIQLPLQAGDLLLSLPQPGLRRPVLVLLRLVLLLLLLQVLLQGLGRGLRGVPSPCEAAREGCTPSPGTPSPSSRTSRHPAHDIVNFNGHRLGVREFNNSDAS